LDEANIDVYETMSHITACLEQFVVEEEDEDNGDEETTDTDNTDEAYEATLS
jgi:hypothetical protein